MRGNTKSTSWVLTVATVGLLGCGAESLRGIDSPTFPAHVQARAEQMVPPETADPVAFVAWLAGTFVHQEPGGRVTGWVVGEASVAPWVDGVVAESWTCEPRWHEEASVVMHCRTPSGRDELLPWNVIDRDAIVHGAWPERRLERLHAGSELP